MCQNVFLRVLLNNTLANISSYTVLEYQLVSILIILLSDNNVLYNCDIRTTSIYTTQALVCNSSESACTSANDLIDLDVMLVGTNDGKILKIVMTYNGIDHIPLISEELSVSFKT